MSTLLKTATSILAVCIVLASNSLKAESHSLDLSGTGSLEEVFESGLKPYRQRGFENYKCEVRNVEVSVILPGGVMLPNMAFEWAEFFVYKNDLLGCAEFRTESVSIDQARTLLIPFLKLAQKPSQEQLERMFQIITENPLGFEPSFSLGVDGVPTWRVFFRKSYDKDKPITIGLKIDWKRGRAQRAFRETVIEPPPGYEYISMEPPPIQAQVQPSTTATQSSSILTQQPQSSFAPKSSPTETRSAPSRFPIVPVAIAVAFIVGILIFLLRRKST